MPRCVTCVREATLRSSPQASYIMAANSSGGRGLNTKYCLLMIRTTHFKETQLYCCQKLLFDT